ncbi:MAG: hypothetical protein AABM67_17130 [Acidobacteriota bacterium]
MLKNFSPKNGSRLPSALPRLVMSGVLLLMLAITASAYTLVFRNGQRLEIPAEFSLTRTTLTYEISPGFNKTMLLTLVDVAATERANNEAPGSFFKHREEAPVVPEPAPRAIRTITNNDLAAVRQRRIESERAYETRRKELGLPTVEETRKRQEAEAAVLRAELREKSAAMAEEESYWRGRARQLRLEIATVDTQINYLRGRVSELNETSLLNRPIITETYPIWGGDRRRGRFPNRGARPTYGLGFPYPPFGYPQYPNQYPNQYPTGPFDNFGNNQQQADLTTRMDDLLVRRAGLAAQWRALEDEARDARVPQVWLEP